MFSLYDILSAGGGFDVVAIQTSIIEWYKIEVKV